MVHILILVVRYLNMTILDCIFNKIYSYDDITCWINHPLSEEKVFYVTDAPRQQNKVLKMFEKYLKSNV